MHISFRRFFRLALAAASLGLTCTICLAGPTGIATPAPLPVPATSSATLPASDAATRAKRDFTTPESALKTFADALKLHDAESLAACFEKPETGDSATPAFLEVVLNSVRLKRAVTARFGEETLDQFELTPTMSAMLDLGRQAAIRPRLRVEVGTARLPVNKDVTLVLHQTDAGWFIDPSSFVQVKPEQRGQAADALPMLRAIAKSLADAGADMDAGKYKSVSEASRAIRLQYARDTRAATRPATTTSTRPAGATSRPR